jgi:isoleucyl-tRNA synthetase
MRINLLNIPSLLPRIEWKLSVTLSAPPISSQNFPVTFSHNSYSPHLLTLPTGSELVDVSYTSLFSNSSTLKIIPGAHVTSESGTGLVHCAPAHGGEDYQLFLDLNLLSISNPMICHVNGEGRFTPEVANVVGDRAAASLVGKGVVTNGSKAIVELLRESGSLVKIKTIRHRYPYDWKTDEPIIVTWVLQPLSH